MHDLVRNQLEELLAGQLAGPARQEIEAHLAACAGCRETVQKMRSHSRLVASLRAPASMEPAAGFYARVLQSIEDQGRPSFWHLLLDPVFGRRLMYATAALVLMMGTILFVTAPEHPELALTPVEVMAQPASAPAAFPLELGEDVRRDRERFLVTMASHSD